LLAWAHRRTALPVALVLVGCAALLTGCTEKATPAPAAPAVLTIGLLAPATGAAEAVGRSAKQGAELAVDVVNAAHPGLPLPFGPSAGLSRGTRLALVTGDTKGDPPAGAEAADQLLGRSRPAALVVADSAVVVAQVSQRAEEGGVSLVDVCSSAEFLGELGRQWYFRLGPSDAMLAATTLDVLRQETPAARRVVVLQGASVQAAGGASGLADVAQSRGITVAGELPVVPGSTSPADLAEKIGVQKPDVLIALTGTPQEAAVITDATQRLKGSVPLVAVGPDAAGLTGRGAMRTAAWSADFAARNPVTRAIGEMYQKRYGAPMDDAAARAFTAVLVLAVAMDTVGTGDRVRIRAALSQTILQATDTIMPWNGVRFDPRGQNSLAAGVVEQRVGDGFRLVYPRELAPRVGP
jgi:branched-chain amino acid transport system substrate-binding protein